MDKRDNYIEKLAQLLSNTPDAFQRYVYELVCALLGIKP